MRAITFAKIAITDQKEAAVIAYLGEEEEKRGLETIKIDRLQTIAREKGIRALKVDHHRDITLERLGWPGEKEYKLTKESTTQLSSSRVLDPTRMLKQKQFGITNRRNVMVATDTMPLSMLNAKGTEALGTEESRPHDSEQYVQIFVEMGETTKAEASGFLTAIVMKKKSDYPIALRDFIRNRFIPKRMWIDGAKEEDSEAVSQIYRSLYMQDPIKSEPEHQYQNPCEVLDMSRIKRKWRRLEVLGWVYYNYILPLKFAKYKIHYIVNLLNHTAYCTTSTSGLQYGKTPIERADGETPDVSQYRFGFLQPVIYNVKMPWPQAQLKIGRSLGPSITGNFLSQYILTDGGEVISKSAVESVDNIRKKFGNKSMMESEGEKRSDPNIELVDQQKVIQMMSDFEPIDDAAYMEELQQHKDLDKSLDEEKRKRDGMEVEEKGNDSNQTETDAIVDEAFQEMEVDKPVPADRIPQAPLLKGTKEAETDDDTIQDRDYEVLKIISRNEPGSQQQRKVFLNIPEDNTMTQRGQLSLEVEWKGVKGYNTMEPFNRLKEDCPQMVAEYVRAELGALPKNHKNRALANAVRWANDYLMTEDKELKTYIQRLATSEYYNSKHKCKHIEEELRVRINKIREEKATSPTPDEPYIDLEQTCSYNKMGVLENERIQYGVRVPQGSKEAQKFEAEDGNKWLTGAAKAECIDKLIEEFEVFGLGEVGATCPEGYQEIKLKIVYSNSPDNTLKARCCAVGCGVDSGNLNRYFSVIDLTNARAIKVVAVANRLELRVIDVKSAYVTCRAQEKVWVRSLPAEFGIHAGKSATVDGNLYGLNTAGAVWACSCRAKILEMGFTKVPGDGGLYMRRVETEEGPYYEYICTFVDDLLIASKRMSEVVEELNEKWKFKHSTNMVNGVRYVGADCKHNLEASTLDVYCYTYIEEALHHIESQSAAALKRGDKTFQLLTARADQTPMLEDDHPENLEGTEDEFLTALEIVTYQSYIGSLQWCCILCRIDVEYPVKTISSYNAAPKKGHAKRVMRIWSFLKANPKRGIRIDPRDFVLGEGESTFQDHHREHLQIDYGNEEESRDPRDPEPLGKALTLVGFSDANHAHNRVSRRSTSGRAILLGKTILSWKSKNQVGCEGSSYGSELRAAALCAQELRGFRAFLRSIGVLIKGPSILLVDNAAALYAATNLATTLKAKHLSIDYNSIREWTAWGILQPEWCPTKDNLADVFTKPVDAKTFWRLTNNMMVSQDEKGEPKTVVD